MPRLVLHQRYAARNSQYVSPRGATWSNARAQGHSHALFLGRCNDTRFCAKGRRKSQVTRFAPESKTSAKDATPVIRLESSLSGDRASPHTAELRPNLVKLRGSVYITFHPLNKFDLHRVSHLAR